MKLIRDLLFWFTTSYLIMGIFVIGSLLRFILHPGAWTLIAFAMWTSFIIREVEDRQGPSMGPWY